jgi:DNA-binding MarR family transcriptional regulator
VGDARGPILVQLQQTSKTFLAIYLYTWRAFLAESRPFYWHSFAPDPGVRLRDIAATLGVTKRTAYRIVTDLTAAGYVVKDNDSRHAAIAVLSRSTTANFTIADESRYQTLTAPLPEVQLEIRSRTPRPHGGL